MRKLKFKIDSGAYSAWSLSKEVKVESYTKFCLDNAQHIDHVVNLDYIDPANPENAAAIGWDNLLYMRDRGIDPVPVYHARESIKWFDKMLLSCNYIGISGTSIVSTSEHMSFYDHCFHYGTDADGKPIAKYHAFGDTAPESLLTYPWYSCDSATWMIAGGRAGSIRLNGKTYRLRSKKVHDRNYISSTSTGIEKQSWEEACRELGLNPEAVMNEEMSGTELAMIRGYMVVADLLKLRERTIDVTRFKKPSRLFSNKRQETGGFDRGKTIDLYTVVSPTAYYFNLPVVAALKLEHILVSYFYITRERPDFFQKLVHFMEDPIGFCQTDVKAKKMWDKLNKCLLHPIETNEEVTLVQG